MELKRSFVAIVSLAMFCFQCKTAVQSLVSPPTVDTTVKKNITDVDLPIITICPTNQTNLTRLHELGTAKSVKQLLQGYSRCDFGLCLSWGKSVNLTFEQLLEQVFNKSLAKEILLSPGNPNLSVVLTFLPRYGFCKEIINYSPEFPIKISIKSEYKENLKIFITDRNQRSYFSPNFSTHRGDKTVVRPDQVHYLDVQLAVTNNCEVDRNELDDVDYKKCVDEKIQNNVGSVLGCNPPWLSATNQCNATYPRIFTHKIPDFDHRYTDLLYTLGQTKEETECRNSCKSLKTAVHTRDIFDGKLRSKIVHINFDQTVLCTEKKFNYDLFKFVVDIGSNLGLWLGLSVLGLYDLADVTIQLLKNKIVCSKCMKK